MKGFVFDASPLIYLGKVGLLRKTLGISAKNVIPKAVHEEVVNSGEGYPDASIIKDLISAGRIHVIGVRVSPDIEKLPVSRADREVIQLAHQENYTAVMDDQDLRAMAEHKGVDCVGTFFMILHLIHKKELSKKQALDKLDQMIKEGWYCSTEFYSVIRKELG